MIMDVALTTQLQIRHSGHCSNFACRSHDRENWSAFKLAPPTRAPSILGFAINSLALSPLTLPPYWIRVASATVGQIVRSAIFGYTRDVSGLFGRSSHTRSNRPDGFVGNDNSFHLGGRTGFASPSINCVSRTALVRSDCRSANSSPRRKSPSDLAPVKPRLFLLMISSVSPKN